MPYGLLGALKQRVFQNRWKASFQKALKEWLP
jgi:hypothetical protein